MSLKNVLILGVSADIGAYMCRRYIQDGYQVFGTYRRYSRAVRALKGLKGLTLMQCDVSKKNDAERLAAALKRKEFFWDIFFSSVGTTEPIGPFFSLSFQEWEASVGTNSLDQLKVLHAIYPYRQGKPCVIFLAGGGTNSPFRSYSAYCLAKIMLIKMCEFLDDEESDLKISIIGPGFVRTKTHQETLRAGKIAGSNYDKVKRLLADQHSGTSLEDIYRCLLWVQRQDRKVVGGRNFSVVHDAWGTKRLAQKLLADKDMYKLRRAGNDWHDKGVRDGKTT